MYNNYRPQGGLALEENRRTLHWEKRVFQTLLGVIEVNTYLAFTHFTRKCMSHSQFFSAVCAALVEEAQYFYMAETQDARQPQPAMVLRKSAAEVNENGLSNTID